MDIFITYNTAVYIVLGIGVVLLILRMWMNASVIHRDKLEYTGFNDIEANERYNFLENFTFYFTVDDTDSNYLRWLKRTANKVSLAIGFYLILLLCFFLFVRQIHFPENYTITQREVEVKDGCWTNPPDSFLYTGKTNEERGDLGIVALNDFMKLQINSIVNQQVWIDPEIFGHPYYHKSKTIYLNGEQWLREYDVFYHNESQIREEITANAEMMNDSLIISYTFNRKPINELEFDSIMRIWGFVQ